MSFLEAFLASGWRRWKVVFSTVNICKVKGVTAEQEQMNEAIFADTEGNLCFANHFPYFTFSNVHDNKKNATDSVNF